MRQEPLSISRESFPFKHYALLSSGLIGEKTLSTKRIHLLSFCSVIILSMGLNLPVMNIDAAQYAEISREMAKSGDWLHVTLRGKDYLDKPPLLFWLSATSFKIFGVSNWSYRLPSFLFFILSLFSVIRTARIYHGDRIAAVAGLFFSSSFSALLMCSDVRTDTMLVGAFSLSIWMFALFETTGRTRYLFCLACGVGLAMLSKGPMGFIFPAVAIAFHLAWNRKWKIMFDSKWLIVPFVVAIMLLPMCIGLYEQFDLHPEKMVNGHSGVSGLRFYFWTQSFGRITGESDWGTKFNNGATNFFFTHTFLWTFAPWTLMAIGGLAGRIFRRVRDRLVLMNSEALSWGGFILIFLALSFSRYKLPHYLYVTIPFISIVAAVFFVNAVETSKMLQKIMRWVHSMVLLLIILVIQVVLFRFFPGASWWMITLCETGILVSIYFLLLFRRSNVGLLLPISMGMLCAYFVLLCWFYPALLKYDSGHSAGDVRYAANGSSVIVYLDSEIYDFTFGFYSREEIYAEAYDLHQLSAGTYKAPFYLWLNDRSYHALKQAGFKPDSEQRFDHYSVQFLTIPFLFPEKRAERLSYRWLVRFNAGPASPNIHPEGH